MLDILRANARSALTYVLFGIIIVVFVVSFGPGSCGQTAPGGRADADVATVNGVAVTLADLEQHYGQLYRSYQQQAGEAFTRELAERLGLRRAALDQLVDRVLVRQEAAEHGLVVTDEDLSRAVKEIPGFQSGGRFDHEYYTRAVSQAYGSPARFEARLREDLAVEKMLALVRQTAKVSPEEVRRAFLEEGDRVSLEYVRFPLSLARGEVKVAAPEVEAFAAANADRVKKAYDEGKDRWNKPKRVTARHILAKADADAPADANDAARRKAEQALERARKGEDFAKLAAELSDDGGTKARGGDLGSFGPGVMAKEFEEAAFALKPGELGGPVRTRFGWHVVKVDQVQEPETVPFEKARADVARELLEADRAKELAQRRAAEALAAAKAGRPLAQLFPSDEKAKGAVKWSGQLLRAEETGAFGRGEGSTVPRLGDAPELAAAAFAADGPKVLEKVFDTAAGPVVARVKERQRPDDARFEQRRPEVEARLRGDREREIQQAWMKELRARAKVSVDERYLGAQASAQ
jgi:peptidyl-prolyl cis-trans isomerase D